MVAMGSFLQAFPSGARGGHSGGAAFNGASCTECHGMNIGGGSANFLNVPRRYRSGQMIDLQVKISDPQQSGAGFEISSEIAGGYSGNWIITDSINTQFSNAGTVTNYVTHTRDGVDDSIAQWQANGGSYSYTLRWQAPNIDEGRITLYAAGNAVNDANGRLGDRYYAAYALLNYGMAGDANGDEDIDLEDVALLQQCLGEATSSDAPECEYFDSDHDQLITLDDFSVFSQSLAGPTTVLPAAYLLADEVRGARLFDKWWMVNGSAAPTGKHPLYPASGLQNGATTYRCKECHGWDYKGVNGVYGSGSHFTGIAGVLNTTRSPRELLELLQADPEDVEGGHNMGAYGMSDADLWDVIKFALTATIDEDDYINSQGQFQGDESFGSDWYYTSCRACHGNDGRNLNFGSAEEPEYVGTVAVANPWEFMHKVRFGHLTSPMPALHLFGEPIATSMHVGTFAATLPTE